ncbi:MAG: type II secretion system F family protein [Candidatus Goldbacteria bacterium]|nr:type II secretion system F family protein [Candidatus Goldiibacteriota bacterium]
MRFLFSVFAFAVVSSGVGGLGVMFYRYSMIKKLKNEKTISFSGRIKDVFFSLRKHVKSVNLYFTRNEFYEGIRVSLKVINYENKVDKEDFLLLQEIFSVLFFVLFFLIFNQGIIALIACAAGFYLPVMILKTKIGNKREKILKELPDAMDVIAANIESGLSINHAISRYADKNKNLFSEELQMVLQKVQIGKSFEEALMELDEKLGIKEITSFVNSFIQAGKTGGNVKKIIKDQAEEIRKKRFQFLKKKANQAPVKLLIPLILFIFPVIFIVLFGPIVIKILAGF